jgi:hypothetical protein
MKLGAFEVSGFITGVVHLFDSINFDRVLVLSDNMGDGMHGRGGRYNLGRPKLTRIIEAGMEKSAPIYCPYNMKCSFPSNHSILMEYYDHSLYKVVPAIVFASFSSKRGREHT